MTCVIRFLKKNGRSTKRNRKKTKEMTDFMKFMTMPSVLVSEIVPFVPGFDQTMSNYSMPYSVTDDGMALITAQCLALPLKTVCSPSTGVRRPDPRALSANFLLSQRPLRAETRLSPSTASLSTSNMLAATAVQ